MDHEIKVTSAAEGPEIEVTSAEADLEYWVRAAEGSDVTWLEILSCAEGSVVGRPSAAEATRGLEVGGWRAILKGWRLRVRGWQTKVISAAGELKVGGPSCAGGPEVGRPSAAEASEIEMISAAGGLEVGGPSCAEGPVVRKYWLYDSTTSSDSIFRAPAHMRYGRESDFEPKLVSIGPYHRGRQNLQPMEEKKVWCMKNLLMMRTGDENKGENKYLFYNRGGSNMDHMPVNPFMKFESRARSYYKEKFDQISNVDFVQMLLLDSCFVILILLSFRANIPESMGSLEVNIKEVRSDLLLLENQIPLSFLNVVYYWLFPNAHEFINLTYVLLWYIRRDLPWEYSLNCVHFESNHLLDFYWKSSVPNTEQLIEEMKSHKLRQIASWADIPDSLPKLIENATELHQTAGIISKSGFAQGVQVRFSKGIMQMHCLKIDATLTTSLVNLIAFESSMPPSLQIISTYVKFLDDLIDSEKDVELLQKFGVIFNTLSTHTEAATFFNDIGNLCFINENHNPFSDLFRNVTKYHKSRWNRRLASLQNNYFNSPWAGISVFAGAMLLILTVLATFYTIYAYYNPRN